MKRGDFGSYSQSWTLKRWLLPLWILSLLMFSTGCGTSSKMPPIQVDTIQAERPPAKPPLPRPAPVETLPVDWTVVATEDGPALALTEEQFQHLAQNLAELLRWIREAAWRLHYYDTAP